MRYQRFIDKIVEIQKPEYAGVVVSMNYLADVIDVVLTEMENLSDDILRAPYNEGILRYGTCDSDQNPLPKISGEIFAAMIRAIREGK